jgi:hypothetical protein
MDIKQLARVSVGEVLNAAREYSRVKGVSMGSAKLAFAITKDVVKHVEEVGLREKLANADKRALAVELVILAAKPSWWLEKVLRLVLPHVVDLAVSALKDKFGK